MQFDVADADLVKLGMAGNGKDSGTEAFLGAQGLFGVLERILRLDYEQHPVDSRVGAKGPQYGEVSDVKRVERAGIQKGPHLKEELSRTAGVERKASTISSASRKVSSSLSLTSLRSNRPSAY